MNTPLDVSWGRVCFLDGTLIAHGLRRPRNCFRFLLDRRRKDMSIKIVALDPDYWGRGLNALMYGELARQMAKKGFTWSNLSLTGEDNAQTNKLAKVVGAEVCKRYRIYHRDSKVGNSRTKEARWAWNDPSPLHLCLKRAVDFYAQMFYNIMSFLLG